MLCANRTARQAPGVAEEEVVRTFVSFEKQESAIKAFLDMEGRYFSGRQIRCSFFNEERFKVTRERGLLGSNGPKEHEHHASPAFVVFQKLVGPTSSNSHLAQLTAHSFQITAQNFQITAQSFQNTAQKFFKSQFTPQLDFRCSITGLTCPPQECPICRGPAGLDHGWQRVAFGPA